MIEIEDTATEEVVMTVEIEEETEVMIVKYLFFFVSYSDTTHTYSIAHRSSYSSHQPSYTAPVQSSPDTNASTPDDGSDRKRKRKSRWGDEQKVIMPGLPTSISKMNKEQSEKYLCKWRRRRKRRVSYV